MSYEDVNSIRLLKNLFDQCRENGSSDSENEGDFLGVASGLTPASIKPKKCEVKKTLENSLLKKVEADVGVKSLEEWEKLQAKDGELFDSRKQPDFIISYKQAVTTEDMFLGMGLKTPATSSCEDMIVQISLPEETVKIDQIELKVEEGSIDLQSPTYRLKLLLPHKIHPNKGRAEFDADKKNLTLTLRLNREYDFVNF